MNKTQYASELDSLFETVEFDYSQSLIHTLSTKAAQLEEESLGEEDIYEELLAILPDDILDNPEMLDILVSLSDIVYSEQDTSDEELVEEGE